MPSKLIDYAIINRPILNVKNDFDRNVVLEFISGDYTHATRIENIDQYRIENVCQKFLALK